VAAYIGKHVLIGVTYPNTKTKRISAAVQLEKGIVGKCVEREMNYSSINLWEKFAKFSEHWSPKIIAQMNDYHFKLVRVQGEFVWHQHTDTDEVFLILDGTLRIEFRDGVVELKAGELFVVPKGTDHRPVAARECKMLLVEPSGTINTGDAGGQLTAEDNVWI
jgi:mannose-6-phosphate isomerase-like protein (cupin superfamily)